MNSFLRFIVIGLILFAFRMVNAQYEEKEGVLGIEVSEVSDDGLNDVLELSQYEAETDTKQGTVGGGMKEGREIRVGKDTKDERFELSKGKKVILHGITMDASNSLINHDSATELEKVRKSMEANPDFTVVITGYTDNVGRGRSNRRLSLERAQAVKNWMVENNISVSRIKVLGKGGADPIALNDTAEGRAKNHRVEFVVE